MRTYTADEVDAMIGRALARERERVAQQQEPPTVAELVCVCGAEWEWRNRDWELVATPPAQRKPLTHEQRVDLLAKFEAHKHEWHAPAILIDMVEAAHGIKGDA